MTEDMAPVQKKGMSPLAWIAIGCGGIIVIGLVVVFAGGMWLFKKGKDFAEEMDKNPEVAMSKVFALANPEIDYVGNDETDRTVTFRNNKTGEEFTFDYRDIKEGKIAFSADGKRVVFDADQTAGGGKVRITTDEGQVTYGTNVDMNDFPDWLPYYPNTSPTGNMLSESEDARTGTYSFQTSLDHQTVMDYYIRELEDGGFTIHSNTTMPTGAMVMAGTDDDARSVSINAAKVEETTTISVTFTENKNY